MDDNAKAAHRRWLQHRRLCWHEAVLKDRELHTCPSAIALAGHIMHRYNVDKGYAQLSIASAEKAVPFDQRTLKRARKLLREKGWIRPYERQHSKSAGSWRANKYILGGGPDDLLFDEPEQGVSDDTEG